jgi:hypothetical protein
MQELRQIRLNSSQHPGGCPADLNERYRWCSPSLALHGVSEIERIADRVAW